MPDMNCMIVIFRDDARRGFVGDTPVYPKQGRFSRACSGSHGVACTGLSLGHRNGVLAISLVTKSLRLLKFRAFFNPPIRNNIKS